jgi:hypothetical protein
MIILEVLKEEMTLAVCFTRCDAISAIVGLLNDTSVVSAHACILHTLLDVIPLDIDAHACFCIPVTFDRTVCSRLVWIDTGGWSTLQHFERAKLIFFFHSQ